jgi:hypothetical protein
MRERFVSCPPPTLSYRALLAWRAAFYDWLADAWDVIDLDGTAPTPQECSALESYFGARPGRCGLCFAPASPEHFADCPLRQGPPLPPELRDSKPR